MTDEQRSDGLAFACPHCGGPLKVAEQELECKRGHRFSVSEVVLEQTRNSSRAAWLAVKALRERAETSRWAAREAQLYGPADSRRMERQAEHDEQTADLLQAQAVMLDLTLWRASLNSDDDGSRFS